MSDDLLPHARTVAENAVKVIFDEDSSVDRINLAIGMLLSVITWQQDRIKDPRIVSIHPRPIK